MDNKHILAVIEELGGLLEKYKHEIKYKDLQIESLNKKIAQIEQYIEFYSEGEKGAWFPLNKMLQIIN